MTRRAQLWVLWSPITPGDSAGPPAEAARLAARMGGMQYGTAAILKTDLNRGA
jgi:hypothetical protein